MKHKQTQVVKISECTDVELLTKMKEAAIFQIDQDQAQDKDTKFLKSELNKIIRRLEKLGVDKDA